MSMRRIVFLFLSFVFLVTGLHLLSCSGEVAVSFPGCEQCPERCLREGNTGKCVDCINDKQCQSSTSPTKKCMDNRCYCGTDKDCPAGRICDGKKGCVECKENSNCKDEEKPVCLEKTCVACNPGDSRACAPEGMVACVKGTQTCKPSGAWGKCENAVSCQEGERCINSKCLPACPDPAVCKKDEKQCTTSAGVYPGKYKECKLNDIQCYEYAKDEKFCGKKEVCDKGACVPFTCPDAECKEGETRCVDDDTQQTCGRDKDNCVVWLPSKACDKDKKCRKSTKQCTLCEPKTLRDCYDGDAKTKDVGECKTGKQACDEKGETWGTCEKQVLPKTDICNGKDDDCDGAIDEDFATKDKECTVGKGLCENKGKYVCAADGKDVECSAKPKSQAKEICNGKDDNCDGKVDELFPDVNKKCKTGKGICEAEGIYICKLDGSGVVCDAKTGTPKTEVCNGKDDNCDGKVDEKLTRQCYTGKTGCTKITGTEFYRCKGECNFGIQNCAGGQWTVCAKEVTPKAQEVCNGKDDNCNGTVDENNPGGGGNCTVAGKFALCAKGIEECKNGSINCKQVNLPKTEICNGKDDDCNGQIDNNVPKQTYYPDDDGDKYGNSQAKGVVACAALAPKNWVTNNTDCDDKVKAINPKATEVCDGVDNNCNKLVDEGQTMRNWYADADKDTFGDKTVIFKGCNKNSTTVCTGLKACRSTAGYVTNNRDCCDKDANAKPGQVNYYSVANKCGNFDYNCDSKATPNKSICSCSKSTRYTRGGYADKYRTSWARWWTYNTRTLTYANPYTCELDLSTSLAASSNTSLSCSDSWCSSKVWPVCTTTKSCTTTCTLFASRTTRTYRPRCDGGKKCIMWRRSSYKAGCAFRLDGQAAKCGDPVQSAGTLRSVSSYKPSGTTQSTLDYCSNDSGRCRHTCYSRINYSFSVDNSTYGYSNPGTSYKLPCR